GLRRYSAARLHGRLVGHSKGGMRMRTRRTMLVALALGALMVMGGSLVVSARGNGATSAGTLDDGKELLPQAKISLAQAVQAAQGAASGALGEVDVEYYCDRLVFNVDVGQHDVKVD